MNSEHTNLNDYLEIIKNNIKISSSYGPPLIIYTVIPNLQDNYYVNIAKTIQNMCSYHNCLFILTDILVGMGVEQLIEKIKNIKVDVAILIDVNHQLKEQLKENCIKTINVDC